MRFAVDAHTIGCHLTGNEVYIRNLLNEFAKLDAESEFIAFVSKPDAGFEVPACIRTRRVSANPYCRLGFDLPLRLRGHRPDLLHVQYTGPIFCPVPLVVSVHDVSFLEHPGYFTRFRAAQLSLTVKRTVESAARVLTPSEFSRRAILQHYPLDERKVVVVPNAVSSTFHPIERLTASAAIEKKFGLRRPFILMVGDLQPRKNHLGLLRAFEEVLHSHPELPHRMVFVGKETWYSKELHREVRRSSIADRVHFTGFVEDADLVNFYGACDLFVFPSFYEGFGLPILEAMACGRAVACSSITAMPEVADAAAILFDPYSTAEMARAISDVLLDSELRTRLERLGSHRAALFSWARAARRTLEVYYEVAGAARHATVRTTKAPPALKVRATS
ncbi:MAG: glycosyltransferase family 1 protein [Acidobacteria bacterium]|jgi:glycosyltransferase involved in cell wall biosynthesis|nr:MAG: glycosyltransferase family 1 protein [Acidobacteriota bacterium]